MFDASVHPEIASPIDSDSSKDAYLSMHICARFTAASAREAGVCTVRPSSFLSLCWYVDRSRAPTPDFFASNDIKNDMAAAGSGAGARKCKVTSTDDFHARTRAYIWACRETLGVNLQFAGDIRHGD